MQAIFDHISRVKERSHEERRRIAVGTATLLTAVIAFAWLSASLATGAFALGNDGPEKARGTEAPNPNLNLAGVAGALSESDASPVRIEVIDTAAPSKKAAEPTTIPF